VHIIAIIAFKPTLLEKMDHHRENKGAKGREFLELASADSEKTRFAKLGVLSDFAVIL
jgi:hypothetical protein